MADQEQDKQQEVPARNPNVHYLGGGRVFGPEYEPVSTLDKEMPLREESKPLAPRPQAPGVGQVSGISDAQLVNAAGRVVSREVGEKAGREQILSQRGQQDSEVQDEAGQQQPVGTATQAETVRDGQGGVSDLTGQEGDTPTPAPRAEDTASPPPNSGALAADFPHRDELRAIGLNNLAAVRRTDDKQILDARGIGVSGLKKIREAQGQAG